MNDIKSISGSFSTARKTEIIFAGTVADLKECIKAFQNDDKIIKIDTGGKK